MPGPEEEHGGRHGGFREAPQLQSGPPGTAAPTQPRGRGLGRQAGRSQDPEQQGSARRGALETMRNDLPSQTWKPRLGRARTCPPARWRPPRRPRPAGYPQGPQSRLPPAPLLAVAHRRGVCLASEHGGSHLPADTSDQLSWSPRGPYDGDGFYGRSFRPACRARSGTRHPAASPTPARCQRPAPHPPPTSSLQGRPAPCTRPWRGPWGEAIRTGDWWGFPQHSETLRGARCSTSSLREPQEVAPAGP